MRKSRYNVQQDLFKEHYGELSREGEPWLNEDIDALLDSFLVDELRYISGGRPCLRKITGRSVEAVSTMLWKLFTNYDRIAVRGYIPGPNRKRRDMLPFTMRDRAVLEAATGQEGQSNGASKAEYIAKILGRESNEVYCWMASLAQRYQRERRWSIGDRKKESLATIVNRQVSGSHRQMMTEIGL